MAPHLLVLKQPYIEISFARPRPASDMAQPGRGESSTRWEAWDYPSFERPFSSRPPGVIPVSIASGYLKQTDIWDNL